jgi:hypothetical protein
MFVIISTISVGSFLKKFCPKLLYKTLAENGLGRNGDQGCQMVYFQAKNSNLGKIWMTLDWKLLIYFMAIWNILQTFEIFYDILCSFGTFFRFWYHVPKISGNPDGDL